MRRDWFVFGYRRQEESRGYSKPGKTASNSSDGEEDLSSVPRAILDALEPGSPVAPTTVRYSRWESKDDEQDEGTRRMSRRSTNDSAESQGTSSTASSGTWGPGHKPVEGSISMADLMKRPSVADRRSVYMPAQRDGSSETTDQDHAGEDPRAMSTWTSSRPSLVPARSTARRRTTWDEQPEIVRTRSILNEELRKNSALLDR